MADKEAGTGVVRKLEPLTPQELQDYFPQKVVVVIQVRDNKTFEVIPENFFVSKELLGEVQWKLEPENSKHGFIVRFTNGLSPFEKAVFSESDANSGTVRSDAVTAYYCYTVTLTNEAPNEKHAHLKPKDPGGVVTG